MIEPEKWRLIFTDSESLSGVAPPCPLACVPRSAHDLGFPLGEAPRFDDMGVYDCCPQPHIECWTVSDAQVVLLALNTASAELCS